MAAVKLMWWRNHSRGWPSTSGSSTTSRRPDAGSMSGIEGFDQSSEVTENLRLREILFHELPPAGAQLRPRLRIISKRQHGPGKGIGVVRRSAQERATHLL